MLDQRHSQPQQTSHHASPSPAPLHAVAAEPDSDAATEYDLPPRQQPLDIGDAIARLPDSEPAPPPPACRTGDEQGLVPVEYRSLPSTAACTIANGEPIAGWLVAIPSAGRYSLFYLLLTGDSEFRLQELCFGIQGCLMRVCPICTRFAHLCFICILSMFSNTFVLSA